MLLGGLYLIWCDAKIDSESVETLVLMLVYVYFIRFYLYEYCKSIQGIENCRGSLDKVKVSAEKSISFFFKNIQILPSTELFRNAEKPGPLTRSNN